jgi:hypothetical protein
MNYPSTNAAGTANEGGSDTDPVHQWRHEQFVRLGFDSSQAALLADCSHVDLGQVRDLLSRGCERGTLMRIVI